MVEQVAPGWGNGARAAQTLSFSESTECGANQLDSVRGGVFPNAVRIRLVSSNSSPSTATESTRSQGCCQYQPAAIPSNASPVIPNWKQRIQANASRACRSS